MKARCTLAPLLVAMLFAAGCQTSRDPVPLAGPVSAPPPPPPAAFPLPPPPLATPVAGGAVDVPAPAPAPAEVVPAALLFQHHGAALPISEDTLSALVKAQLGAASFSVIDPRDVLGEPLPATTPVDLARKCGARVLVSASVSDARVRSLGGSDAGYKAVFELSLSALDAATGANLAPVNAKRESRIYDSRLALENDAANVWTELARAAATDASAKLRTDWAAVRPPAAAPTVRVTFAANVPGANVRVGDVSYGTLGADPLVPNLPAGVHPVEIAYPGYVAFKDRVMFFEGASFAVALVLNAEGRAALERDAQFRLLCERVQKGGLTDDLAKELVARGYAKFLEASHVQLQGMPKFYVPVGAAPDLGLSPGGKPEAASGVGGLLEKASSLLP